MGVALGMGRDYWEGTGICGDCIVSTNKTPIGCCKLLMVLPRVQETQKGEDT